MVASRRALYVLAVIPGWAIAAVVFFSMWPWLAALLHLAFLALLGAILAELCLYNFHKIPFTCSYLPGRSYAHMAFLSFIGLMLLIAKGADLERRELENPAGMAVILVLCGILAAWARHRTAARAKSPQGKLQFEEAPVPAILALGLNRDGTSSV
jgi:lysylphosphatidylglycerol synthetase-like protein (DUF2156 family)